MAQRTSADAPGTNLKPVQVKLVLLGEAAVGKSSLVLRFVNGEFQDNKEPTIGAAFLTQKCKLEEKIIKFEIWDTAGRKSRCLIARGTLPLPCSDVLPKRPGCRGGIRHYQGSRTLPDSVLILGFPRKGQDMGEGAAAPGEPQHCDCASWKQAGFGSLSRSRNRSSPGICSGGEPVVFGGIGQDWR